MSFRVTLHRVDDKSLEQVVRYVGGKSDGRKAGRTFPRKGIIGQVARTGEPAVYVRVATSEQDYINELMAVHGYELDEAEALLRGRWSQMGVPVSDAPRKAIAVVYADSSEPDFFDERTQEMMVRATEGIASFVKERYAKS